MVPVAVVCFRFFSYVVVWSPSSVLLKQRRYELIFLFSEEAEFGEACSGWLQSAGNRKGFTRAQLLS